MRAFRSPAKSPGLSPPKTPYAPRTEQLACRFCRDESPSDSPAATSWYAERASGGQATDVGADDTQNDKLDRSAKPGSGGATFVVMVQAAEVGDGDDPGRQLTQRPLEIAIAIRPNAKAGRGSCR